MNATTDPSESRDWENAGPYEALLGLDGCCLAWEFLRRNNDYAATAKRHRPLRRITVDKRSTVPVFAATTASDVEHWGVPFRGRSDTDVV